MLIVCGSECRDAHQILLQLEAFSDCSSSMIGWLAPVSVDFPHVLDICAMDKKTRSYNLSSQVLQTSQVSRASLYLIHSVASLTARNIAMMFDLIYGVASFIVIVVVIMIVIVLLCVFKLYLALTATCREHRAFLLESATREEQERFNRGQRELEADRRNKAEEERPRRFGRRRLPVQHDERRCLGVSIRFINSFYD